MAAALRCVRPQFQWYQLYATEMKSIQLHDYRRAQPKDSIHYITLHSSPYPFRRHNTPFVAIPGPSVAIIPRSSPYPFRRHTPSVAIIPRSSPYIPSYARRRLSHKPFRRASPSVVQPRPSGPVIAAPSVSRPHPSRGPIRVSWPQPKILLKNYLWPRRLVRCVAQDFLPGGAKIFDYIYRPTYMQRIICIFSSLIHAKFDHRGGHGPMAHNVATRLSVRRARDASDPVGAALSVKQP